MIASGMLLLDIDGALEQRLGLRETAGPHIDVGDEVESLARGALRDGIV